MANNYTTTQPTTVEFTGDNVADGSLPSTYDIIITPNSGHVIQASDFSIGSTLPIDVANVTFSNTTTALDPSNQVIAAVELVQTYVKTAGATTIEVDIDGTTHVAQARLNFTSIYNVVSNTSVVTTIPSVTTPLTSGVDTFGTSGDITTYDNFIDCPVFTNNHVLTVVISTDTGYHFTTTPIHSISSQDASKWSYQTAEQYNSNNKLTKVTFQFYYDIDDVNIPLSNGESIIFSIRTVQADDPSSPSIDGAGFLGYKDQDILPTNIDLVPLIVDGSNGATYNVSVQNSFGEYYNFTSETFAREASSLDATIGSGDLKLTRSSSHDIYFPTFYKRSNFSQYWVATVTPTGSTYSDATGTARTPYVVTLNQFGDVDYSLVTTAHSYGVNATSTTIKSITDKAPLSYLSTFIPSDFPQRASGNNGYFTYSSDLGYTVTGTVSSHTHAGTDVTLNETHASLKLQVGDAVTGTGVDTGSTISSFPGGSIIRLSKTSTETITGTLTFTRTVGISRQPTIDDITVLANGTTVTSGYSGQGEYIVTQNTTNSPIVQLSNVDNDFSSIQVGMSVTADSIYDYPTVLSISNGNLTMSTNQTLSAGEIISFSPDYSELELYNIEVTGAGTSSCKLIAEGHVNRVGKADVVASLLLENFITTYAAPTAATIDLKDDLGLTCVLGGTIKFDPRSLCTTNTGILTISSTPSRGAGSAVIGSGGEYIIYNAPTTDADLSDVITYTVNDGINTSASANITITLTQ